MLPSRPSAEIDLLHSALFSTFDFSATNIMQNAAIL